MAACKQPPVGLEPEWIWREKRIEELMSALHRYINENICNDVMVGWAKELENHLYWINEHRKELEKKELECPF